ncbi:MAG: hypothetical protein Q4A27_01360, partial [bacterium]|nr:hypothetical protein [bacterium]
ASRNTQKNNCILFEDLEEVFQPMWQPRSLKTSKKVSLYDATTGEVVDTRPEGLVVNFVDKAILKNGKECLRSDASRNTQKNNCILFEDLEEISIKSDIKLAPETNS